MAETDKNNPADSVVLEDNPNRISIYANLVSITATPEEIILFFGERTIDGTNQGKELVRVYLSHSHAKRVATAMKRSITGYEELFGRIEADPSRRLTPDARKKLGIEERESDATESES
jgi:hypothetical protein